MLFLSVEKIFAVLRGLKALHSSKLRHGHLTPSVIEMNKATGEIRLGNILRGVFPVSLVSGFVYHKKYKKKTSVYLF